MEEHPKTIWIVDGAYMFKATPIRFDYLKLKKLLEAKVGTLFRESYYLISTDNNLSEGQDQFHTWLKSAPPKGPKMRVKLYKLKNHALECNQCGNLIEYKMQKGVDVGVATLIIKLATQNQYDRLILCAGDGDFEDAIEFVKETLQKEIWLCGFENSISSDLQSYANEVIWLNDHFDAIRKADPAGS